MNHFTPGLSRSSPYFGASIYDTIGVETVQRRTSPFLYSEVPTWLRVTHGLVARCEPRTFSGDPRHHHWFGTESSARGQQEKGWLSNIVELLNTRSGFIRTVNARQSTSTNCTLSMSVSSQLLSCTMMSTQTLRWTDPRAGSRMHRLNKNFETTAAIMSRERTATSPPRA
jgi:hypothetical protein